MKYPSITLADMVIQSSHDGFMKNTLPSSVRFYIDNVADYWHEHAPTSADEVERMVPNAAPLGDNLWFEWRTGDITYGLFYYNIVDIVKEPGRLEEVTLALGDAYFAGAPMPLAVPEDCRWVIGMVSIICHHRPNDSRIVAPDPWAALFLRGDGSICGGFHMGDVPFAHTESPESVEHRLTIRRYGPAMLAICFAHCKNVTQSEMRPTRQILRAAERTGKNAPVYKVLDIDPAKNILRNEGDIAHHGLRKALHLVRAHFATYTADRPAFGRVTGTFFKPMHVRGSEEAGAVIKDYQVLAPRKEA